jgi:hypothetical protein
MAQQSNVDAIRSSRRPRGREVIRIAATLLALTAAGCAGLGQLLGVREPTFAVVQGRPSTLRIGAPSITHPKGTATVRIWTQVTNPNAFGLTLSTLDGKLALEGKELIDVALPLGLPLAAAADTIIPLDLTFGFESLSALGSIATRVLSQEALGYELRGTLGVRAGPLGEPKFGPRTWLRGSVEVQNPLRLGR